jgi:integrase-like protein
VNTASNTASKINHPWTNGQVERMNRTIKDATVKRYHYDDHNQLRRHLADFVDAYNFGRRLNAQRPHTLRVHLKMLDIRPATIQTQPAPANAGTEQLPNFSSEGGA